MARRLASSRILACACCRDWSWTIELDEPAGPVVTTPLPPRRRGGAAILAAGNVLARVAAFVGIVAIARFLSPPDVAVVLLAQAASQYLLIALDFGLTLTGIRAIAAEPDRVRSVMGGTLVIRSAIAIAGLTALLIGGALVGATPQGFATMIGFGLVAVVTATDLSWVGQALGSTTLRSIVTGSAAILGLALTLVLLALAPLPVTVAVAQLIGVSIAVGLGWWQVIRAHGSPRRPARVAVASLLVGAIPLGLASLLAQVYYNLDLLLLAAWRSLEEVAMYGAAYKIIFGLLMLAWTYAGVALPRLTVAHRAGEPDFALELGRDIVTVLAWSVPIAVFVAVSSPVLMTVLFGTAYAGGALPLTILVCSVPIAAVRTLILYSFTAAGRPWAVPLSSGPGAVLNVALNILLIPTFGMIGAAVTTVVAELAVTFVAAFQARRTLARIPWRSAARSRLPSRWRTQPERLM